MNLETITEADIEFFQAALSVPREKAIALLIAERNAKIQYDLYVTSNYIPDPRD